MAAAETARLIASLELQDKNFTRGIRNVERGIGRVDKKLSAFGGFVNRNLARGVDRFAASLVDGVFAGVESLQELEKAQAQTAAVLKSTGQAAGINGAEVTALAEKYESLNAIVGDEFIRSGENMLLTFTNIKKDAFEPALLAALDLNTAMGKGPEGLQSTIIQVGKALNDPTKGLTALRKVGVAFTEDQIKQIKTLQKSGDLLGAQKIILAELNREFSGSFAAEGDTTAGKVAKFNDAVEDLQRTFAKALLPIISKVADKLGTFLGDPAVVAAIEDAGIALGEAFDGMLSAAEKVNWGAIAGGLKAAAGFAGDLVGWFGKFPDWAQALIVGGFVATKLPIVGDIFSEAAKGLIKGVLGINAGIVNVNGPVAGVPGGAGGAGAAGASRLGRIANAVKILGAVTIAGASIALLAETFRGFQETVTKSQQDLLTKVEETNKQGFAQTIANLKGTTKNLEGLQGLDRILAEGFGGSEITKNFEMAADRIRNKFEAGQLTREDMTAAIEALAGASNQADSMNLTIPKTDALIKDLIAAYNKSIAPGRGQADPKDRTPVKSPTKFPTPAALRTAVENGTSAQKAELGNIKNAMATLNTNTSTELGNIKGVSDQQRAELGNIKNAAVTQSSNQVAAAATAGRNVVSAAGRTTSAARGAGLTASAAMGQAATRIVGAVNSLDLSVNVTTVNRTSTVNNRYGPTSGSSQGSRVPGAG